MPETKPSHTARRKPIQGKVRWITVHTASGRAVHIPIPARGGQEPRKLHGAQVAAGKWAAKHNVAAKEGGKEGGKPEPKPEPKPKPQPSKKEPKPKPQPKPKKEVESKIKQAKEHAAKKKAAAEKKVNDAKEREAKKKAREEATKKKAEETATKKKVREEAAKKRADEAVARKKAKEEATKKKSSPKPKPEPKSKPEPKPKPEPKSETKPKPKPEPKSEKKPEPTSESDKHIRDYLEKQRAQLAAGDKEFRLRYGEGIKSYERLAEKTPGLVPDGHMNERLDVYMKAHGNAKIDQMEAELSKFEKEHQSTMRDLYTKHGMLQQRLDKGDESAIELHQESVRKIAERRENYFSNQRDIVTRILKAENPTTIHSGDNEDFGEIHPTVRAYHDDARKFLGSILHDNGESDNFVRLGQIPKKFEQRDHYAASGGKGNTVMSSSPSETSTSTHVHELGHWIDSRVKLNGTQVLDRSLRFLQMRSKGEEAKKIGEVMHSKSYRDDERGWEDEFSKALGRKGVYAGKDYDGRASEIVSMGVQQLYDDPISMTKDRQYLGFILGVLDGRLR